MFSCEFCKIFQITFFTKHLRAAASESLGQFEKAVKQLESKYLSLWTIQTIDISIEMGFFDKVFCFIINVNFCNMKIIFWFLYRHFNWY